MSLGISSSKKVDSNRVKEELRSNSHYVDIDGKLSIIGFTKRVYDKEFRLMKIYSQTEQKEPPRKGIFIDLGVDKSKKGVNDMVNYVLKQIKSKGELFKEVYNGERYKKDSKGPVIIMPEDVKIAQEKGRGRSLVPVPPVTKSQRDGMDMALKRFYREEFSKVYGFKRTASANFNGSEVGKEQDGQRLRGLPFDAVGNAELGISKSAPSKNAVTVDDTVRHGGGLSWDSASKAAKLWMDIVDKEKGSFYIGLQRSRFQPGKVRAVVPVPAMIQYAIAPFVKDLTQVCAEKHLGAAGWNSPGKRESMITQLLNIEVNGKPIWKGCIPISLDYSGFDQLTSAFNRSVHLPLSCRARYSKRFKKNIDELQQIFARYESKKGIEYPSFNQDSPIAVSGAQNLLDSGRQDTGGTGTQENGLRANCIYHGLGCPELVGKRLSNGDDGVIFIPSETYKKLGGYQGVITQISRFLKEKFGAVINVDKQLPGDVLPGFEYLQRFYNISKKIMGISSLTRIVNSLVGAERYKPKPDDVHNMAALQQIGQIATLNEALIHPESHYDNDDIVQYIVIQGLNLDKALRSLISIALRKAGGNIDKATLSWFVYLSRAVGGLGPAVRGNEWNTGAGNVFEAGLHDRGSETKASLPMLEMMTNVVAKGLTQGLYATEDEVKRFYNLKSPVGRVDDAREVLFLT